MTPCSCFHLLQKLGQTIWIIWVTKFFTSNYLHLSETTFQLPFHISYITRLNYESFTWHIYLNYYPFFLFSSGTGSLFYDAFSVTRLYSVDDTVTSEGWRWIDKDKHPVGFQPTVSASKRSRPMPQTMWPLGPTPFF
jgi:hypothetical protein